MFVALQIYRHNAHIRYTVGDAQGIAALTPSLRFHTTKQLNCTQLFFEGNKFSPG